MQQTSWKEKTVSSGIESSEIWAQGEIFKHHARLENCDSVYIQRLRLSPRRRAEVSTTCTKENFGSWLFIAPVAQLVAMQEVVSSTPAGPTLTVFK